MIHYHGTPITPRSELERLPGRHFCVSYVDTRDMDWCSRHGASVMMDNGAFSAWTKGISPDWSAFYAWAERYLQHPNWLVLPDIIDGDEAANDLLLKSNPFRRELVAPVWHMHESFRRLVRLVNDWPKICIGSSGQYAVIGTPEWNARIDLAWKIINKQNKKPWVHMLRAMSAASKGPWPFASADSTNVARNHKGSKTQRRQDIEHMADRIEAVNPVVKKE